MKFSQQSFKRFSIFLTILLLALAMFDLSINAQTSAVDPTFNAVVDKNSTAPSDFILQPDNKIIAFGDFQTVNGVLKSRIARLNPDGSFDAAFNCTICDFTIGSVLLQPDGKIIVAGGTLASISQAVIYRLNADGSRDASFTSPFPPTSNVSRIAFIRAVQPDGKLLVSVFNSLYRLNSDGTFDNTFTIISFQTFFQSGAVPGKTLVLPDGKILLIVDGYGTSGSSDTIRRYNANGTLDTTFEAPILGSGGGTFSSTAINDFSVQPDGSLIIVGTFISINGISRLNMAKLQSAGNVDLSFNAPNVFDTGGIRARVRNLSDGKILVSTETRFIRFNADGTIDNSFVSPANLTQIFSWSLDAAGKIFLYGAFLENGVSVSKFVRLGENGAVESSFNFSLGINSSIRAVAAQADGKTIFAGDFIRVSGVPRTSVARVNADGSLDSTFNAGSGFNGEATKILVQTDGKILIVGSFSNFNGTPRANFARLNADGSLDTNFNPNVSNAQILTVALQPDGKILVGGVFNSFSGQPRVGIVRLNADGSIDTSFNPLFGSATIYAVLVQPDGKILVGGFFNAVNGFNRANLVRLNADGSLDSSFNAGNISVVYQIEAQEGGKYIVLTGTLSRLNNNGTADTAFLSPNVNGTIFQFVVQPDNTILIGGNFTQINNVQRLYLARLRPNGVLDRNFLPNGANGAVRTIVRQEGGRVLVGGDFSVIGGVTRLSIARLNIAPFRLITPFDYDGDGRADLSLFRPTNGNWYILPSQTNGFYGFPFGQNGDQIAPADYDGDGKTDVAVFRDTVPGAGNFAYFYILNSSDNSFRAVQFGATGDVPMAGDWDGDGRGDLAVYRAAATAGGQSFFYYRPSSQPGVDFNTLPLGTQNDKPLLGDFDGDGRLDPAVFRSSSATWLILRSSVNQIAQTNFGLSTDVPVPADYDGDGAANIAVFRPSNGFWYTSTNPQSNFGAVQFGAAGDLPVPADYDGDGRADVAVFRPSNGAWFLNRSTSGFTGVQFGASGDKPAPNAFIR